MKKLNLSQVLGHPFSMDDLRHLQDGLKEAVSAVASGLGVGSFILSGCHLEVTGGNISVTQGYIYHNGEVYPVLNQTIPYQALGTLYFAIKTVTVAPSPVIYKTGNPVNVHIVDVMEIKYDGGTIVAETIGKQSSNPLGAVIMYDGIIADFDETGLGKPNKGLKGWALCNGQNGTPDLRDRFIVGAGEQYLVGATGGQGTVTLTESQIPSHTHGASGLSIPSGGEHSHDRVQYRTHDGSGSGNNSVQRSTSAGNPQDETSTNWEVPSNGSAHTHTITGNVASTGGGQAHENRPPYYALFYIKRIA